MVGEWILVFGGEQDPNCLMAMNIKNFYVKFIFLGLYKRSENDIYKDRFFVIYNNTYIKYIKTLSFSVLSNTRPVPTPSNFFALPFKTYSKDIIKTFKKNVLFFIGV